MICADTHDDYSIGIITLLIYLFSIIWAYGVVVSMFNFQRSDRGSNPGHSGKISCLRLHYTAAPLASV